MTPNRLVTIALLVGAMTTCAAYSQPYRYDTPPGPQPRHDDDRGYDNRGPDDRGYDDRGYDDERGYDASPTPRVDVGFFYDELSPYGDWVRTRDYGWAWFPRDVRPSWRPYTDGRWVTTDYGWLWASNEPFGWATYHYGRWAWDSRIGWLWVPGRDWGPAWVSWQYGGGYIGWAPLPPSVGFEVGIGIRLGGFDLNVAIRPDAYSFVQERSFLDSRLSGRLIPSVRNVTIIHNTTNVTNYTYENNRMVNRGVELRRIEQVTGRRVRPLRVAEMRTRKGTEVAESELRIYRPQRRELDSVRTGRRPETPPQGRDRDRPATQRRDAPDFEVAPRAGQMPHADARQIEQRERRAQQELDRYQADEKRQLDKLQKEEIAKSRAQAERSQVETHHQAEREALQQEQRNASQQLEARQKAQRRAEQVSPPQATPPGERAADPQGKKGKGQRKDKGRGQDATPAPPPA